jgi:hypothetical protein
MRLMREYFGITMLIGVFFKSYLLQSNSICTLFKNCQRYASNSVTIFRYFWVNVKMIFKGICQSSMFQVFASGTLKYIEQLKLFSINLAAL